MRGMLFAGSTREGHAGILLQQQQHQGLLGKVVSGASGGGLIWEPTSVLDPRHSPSPSPPTSASTLSSPLGTATAGVAALAGPNAKNPPPVAGAWPGGAEEAAAVGGGKEEWQLTPLDMGLGAGEGWDPAGAVLSDAPAPPGLGGPDHTFLRWIIGGEDAAAGMGGVMDPPVLELDHAPSSMVSSAFGPNLAFAPPMEDTKPAFGHAPNFLLHHQQHHPQPHAAFFGSHPSFDAAAPKRTHPMGPAPAPKLPPFPPAQAGGGGGGFVVPAALKPKAEATANDEAAAAAVDQLAEAAKLAEAGDAFGAREILARLNYRLPAAPAAGTPPLLRSAFYFKEALRLALSPTGEAPAPAAAATAYDVVLKLGAYKAFSDVSPVLQFAHLTSVQAVLDELGPGAGCVHVLDFDVGMGEQWASLMQELAQRRPSTAALKVTSLVSAASHHPLELQLIHENLAGFANDLGVLFQFAAYDVDALDPAQLLAITGGGDAVAVHLPVGSAHVAAMPAVLRLVKRLGAKVVVAVDRGCDRTELPFAAHLFQAFQSCVSLLECLDAVGTEPETAARIERFLVQPGVDQRVVARHRAGSDKPPLPWRTVLASAGFVPVLASSFAESQAESLLKKVALMGFRVEKRGGALCLYWQRGELVSVSAWRC